MSRPGSQATPHLRGPGPLATVLVAAALVALASGCQIIAEECSMLSPPPNYCHDFAPPSCYGFYPTLWRPWPCNVETAEPEEAEGEKPEEGRGETKGQEETLPEPKEGQVPGDVFEAPTVPPESQPPETETPLLPPGTPGAPDPFAPAPTEPPAETPSAEPLPERLLPDQPSAEPPATEPSATPPGHGRWNMNGLPSDAPEGGLVQDGPDTAGGRSVPPSLLVPDEVPPGRSPKSKRIQNAARPSPVRGTSVTEPPARKPGRRNAAESGEQRIPVAEAASDGPQLLGQSESSHKPAIGRSRAIRDSQSAPAASTADDLKGASGWHSSQSSSGARRSTTGGEGQQKRSASVEYPGRQTSYTKPAAPATSAAPEFTAGGSSNPLR
ncbi:MAG: hypothetical protein HYX69_09430 [Planctomycetia bacterium]|nr:hypothetical protein [Planctomycetia bacterium]